MTYLVFGRRDRAGRLAIAFETSIPGRTHIIVVAELSVRAARLALGVDASARIAGLVEARRTVRLRDTREDPVGLVARFEALAVVRLADREGFADELVDLAAGRAVKEAVRVEGGAAELVLRVGCRDRSAERYGAVVEPEESGHRGRLRHPYDPAGALVDIVEIPRAEAADVARWATGYVSPPHRAEVLPHIGQLVGPVREIVFVGPGRHEEPISTSPSEPGDDVFVFDELRIPPVVAESPDLAVADQLVGWGAAVGCLVILRDGLDRHEHPAGDRGHGDGDGATDVVPDIDAVEHVVPVAVVDQPLELLDVVDEVL